MRCYKYRSGFCEWEIWPEETGGRLRWRLYIFDGRTWILGSCHSSPEDAAESAYFQCADEEHRSRFPENRIPDSIGHLECWAPYNSEEEDQPLSDLEE